MQPTHTKTTIEDAPFTTDVSNYQGNLASPFYTNIERTKSRQIPSASLFTQSLKGYEQHVDSIDEVSKTTLYQTGR